MHDICATRFMKKRNIQSTHTITITNALNESKANWIDPDQIESNLNEIWMHSKERDETAFVHRLPYIYLMSSNHIFSCTAKSKALMSEQRRKCIHTFHSIITTIATDWNNRTKIINMYKESGDSGRKRAWGKEKAKTCTTVFRFMHGQNDKNSSNSLTALASFALKNSHTHTHTQNKNPEPISYSIDVFLFWVSLHRLPQCRKLWTWAHLCVRFSSQYFFFLEFFFLFCVWS